MTPDQITEAMTPFITARGLKLVDIQITKYDDITLTIDAMERYVSMDDCVEVNRKFTELFDQDVEDYSLTVTSAGVKDI